MNVDYAICNALKYETTGITEALVNYDIACQWSIKFQERVDNSQHLSIPKHLKIIPAVGKFHLGAHISECFPLFSLNFVHGAGQQDGEILETLWSSLNKVSGSIRAMSKAHRHEVLDDYMRDSNWKKLVGIGEYFLTFLFIIIDI
jgi:Kyakuja-Dileera-Zisupton transposase